MSSFATYTPKRGDTVHLRLPACDHLTGRYRVARTSPQIKLERISGIPKSFYIQRDEIAAFITGGYVTPIDPAELERDRKAIELRSAAPLRSRRAIAQADVDGLALFDAHRSPQLF